MHRVATMMVAFSSVHEAICLVEMALPFIYVCLSLTAIASMALPFLNDLASHGKSRVSLAAVSSHTTWYDAMLHGETFLVPKRFFLHFYVTGIITTLALYCYIKSADELSNQNEVALALLLSHLSRRVYECLFVHEWRSSSKMHLAGYALGIGHYLLLPIVFLDTSSVCVGTPVVITKHRSVSNWIILVIGAMTCLWAQYQQYRHHFFLAELRELKQDSEKYTKIPLKGWFQNVSCPHYLAEILIYVAFATVLGTRDYKSITLIIWVATNLVVSAIKSHDWYLLRYPDCRAVSQRKAIIPFLF